MLTSTLIPGDTTFTERVGSGGIKRWSAECERAEYTYIGDKYLCEVSEKIEGDHEVRPATMPYVSGDYDNLS